MKRKVVAAGHLCMDITPVFPDSDGADAASVLVPGRLTQVGPAGMSIGGAVANTGLAMKFFGENVYLAGKTGMDFFGDAIEKKLIEAGAADGLIRKAGETTSYTMVLAIPGTDRIFLHHPGANDTFSSEDISDGLLRGASLFHFGYPPLMRRFYEDDGRELVRLFRRAKAAGCVTSLDLAAVDAGSDAGKADWQKILSAVFPYVDIFVPSAEEILFMLDRPVFEDVRRRSAGKDFCEVLDVNRDLANVSDFCMNRGVRILMIKCGAPGLYYRTGPEDTVRPVCEALGCDEKAWAGREGFEKSFVPERVLSGTGAGDAAIAAFLTGMLRSFTPEKCVRFAAAEGACCVEAYDSLSGLRSFEEVEEKLAAGWRKRG